MIIIIIIIIILVIKLLLKYICPIWCSAVAKCAFVDSQVYTVSFIQINTNILYSQFHFTSATSRTLSQLTRREETPNFNLISWDYEEAVVITIAIFGYKAVYNVP
jgi:hypothetical protein